MSTASTLERLVVAVVGCLLFASPVSAGEGCGMAGARSAYWTTEGLARALERGGWVREPAPDGSIVYRHPPLVVQAPAAVSTPPAYPPATSSSPAAQLSARLRALGWAETTEPDGSALYRRAAPAGSTAPADPAAASSSPAAQLSARLRALGWAETTEPDGSILYRRAAPAESAAPADPAAASSSPAAQLSERLRALGWVETTEPDGSTLYRRAAPAESTAPADPAAASSSPAAQLSERLRALGWVETIEPDGSILYRRAAPAESAAPADSPAASSSPAAQLSERLRALGWVETTEPDGSTLYRRRPPVADALASPAEPAPMAEDLRRQLQSLGWQTRPSSDGGVDYRPPSAGTDVPVPVDPEPAPPPREPGDAESLPDDRPVSGQTGASSEHPFGAPQRLLPAGRTLSETPRPGREKSRFLSSERVVDPAGELAETAPLITTADIAAGVPRPVGASEQGSGHRGAKPVVRGVPAAPPQWAQTVYGPPGYRYPGPWPPVSPFGNRWPDIRYGPPPFGPRGVPYPPPAFRYR